MFATKLFSKVLKQKRKKLGEKRQAPFPYPLQEYQVNSSTQTKTESKQTA